MLVGALLAALADVHAATAAVLLRGAGQRGWSWGPDGP